MIDLVSVIMPTYNSSLNLHESIDSILRQTYTNFELVITDDCSSDSSVQIINTFIKSDPRVKLFSLKKNKGAGYARNNSIKNSKGNYIAFCDSDDLWDIDKLEKQVNFMKKNNLKFSCSSYRTIKQNGVFYNNVYVNEYLTKKSMLQSCKVGCLTAIYDAKKLGKLYMPNIRSRQDYALWIQIFNKINETKCITEPLASYRLTKSSVSSNKIQGAINHYKVLKKYGKKNFLVNIFFMIFYLLNGIKKNIPKKFFN